MLLHTNDEEACLTIDNQIKTIGVLPKETKKLASTITSLKKEISSLNSKLGHMIQYKSNMDMLDRMMEFGEMSIDMNRINFGTSMK